MNKGKDHDVLALYRAHHTINEIASMTGLTIGAIRYRLGFPTSRTGGKDRPCMCCGRLFRSQGPHNRLCTDCRRISVTNDELFWVV